MHEPRTTCRTPNPDKPGVTNIPTWKFECIRTAILNALTTGDVAWTDLTDRVREQLSGEELANMGSLGWHVVSVKLEMEVRGEIIRSAGSRRQILSLKG